MHIFHLGNVNNWWKKTYRSCGSVERQCATLERYLALVSSPFASNLMCGFKLINFLSLGPLF